MPMPNEHRARLQEPNKYSEFRRTNDHFGAGIHAIWGILTKPKRKTELQAIAFDAKKFTAAKAKKWLKDHDYKPISFEAASKAQGERQVLAAAQTLDLWLYDTIGTERCTATFIAHELQEQPELVNLHINSTGGDLFEALGIYNTLMQHQAHVTVHIDGVALSSASAVAMAGDEVNIAANAMIMIHEPSIGLTGTKDELQKGVELLSKATESLVQTYAGRSRLDENEVRELMAAETWFDSREAVEYGFADKIVEAKKIAALGDLSAYKNTPAALLETKAGDEGEPEVAAETRGSNEMTEKDEAQANDKDRERNEVEPASLAELKAAFPKSDAAFRERCIEAEMTIMQATAAWAESVQAALDAKTKELEEARKKAEQERKPGVEPIGGYDKPTGRDDESDAVATFDARVREKIKAGMSRTRAVIAVAKADQELHEAYLRATNPQNSRVQALIGERFEMAK